MNTSRRFAEPSRAPDACSPANDVKSAPTASGPSGVAGVASVAPSVILFLAANPIGTRRLAFDEECAAIERELRMTAGRDDFDFRSKWAVTIDEMMRHLNELHPSVIHFSGHGCNAPADHVPASATRDVACDDPGGLYLQDEHGRPQIVSPRALSMMVKAAAGSARVVVLNACCSELHAEALCSVVDCVVGVSGAIRDEAASSFAVGFYRALGNGRSVGNAVEQAVATLAAKQFPDEHALCCRTRRGVDARQLYLTRAGSAGVT
jgi:hypothetical protein